MPLVSKPFRPTLPFQNGHVSTLYPYFTRKHDLQPYERERLELDDGDFMDLDHIPNKSDICVIITHGLEGSSESQYVRGMAKAIYERGFHMTALNLRGCSGVSNRLKISYHSGKTDDLHRVIIHQAEKFPVILLVGFSLGGNLTLKYMGQYAQTMPKALKAGVAISAPCNLWDCVQHMDAGRIYMPWLLASLKQKAKKRLTEMPEGTYTFTKAEVEKVKSFKEFDDLCTAPIHGFDSALDYYEKSQSLRFLPQIARPTLLINALDDPFLSNGCYPRTAGDKSKSFYYLETKYGGHVSYATDFRRSGEHWHETQTIAFFQALDILSC